MTNRSRICPPTFIILITRVFRRKTWLKLKIKMSNLRLVCEYSGKRLISSVYSIGDKNTLQRKLNEMEENNFIMDAQ